MRRAARLIGLLVLACACQRKAPGVPECRALAYRVFGVQTAAELEDPRVRGKVDELIRECLLTPYDRELVLCVEQLGPVRKCRRDFDARRDAPDDGDVPR